MKSEEIPLWQIKTWTVFWGKDIRQKQREAQPLFQCSQTSNPTQKSPSLLVGLCLPVAPDRGPLCSHSRSPSLTPSHPGQPFTPALSPAPASPRHSLCTKASGTRACGTGHGEKGRFVTTLKEAPEQDSSWEWTILLPKEAKHEPF